MLACSGLAARPAPPAEVCWRHSHRRSTRARCLRARASLSVDVAEAQRLWREGTVVIDVRSAREHRSECVARSLNVPLLLVPSSVPLGAVDVVLRRSSRDQRPPFNTAFEETLRAALRGDKTTAALVLCSDGLRSEEAVMLLAEEQYVGLRWLRGGLVAWLQAYTPKGEPRRRVVSGVFRDTSGRAIWTDSAEEDTVLPAPGGNTRDIVS